MGVSIFVSSNALNELTLTAHNVANEDGELTTIRLNRDWRELVTSALYYYFKHGKSELALDNEDFLDDLMADVYDTEVIGMLTTRIENVDMGASQTITTTTYQPVLGSGISHTPTHKNMRMRCENIRLVNSGANETRVIVDIETVTPVELSEFVTNGTDPREGASMAVYDNLEPGEIYICRLMGKRPAGTGTVNRYPFLVWIFEEWDD